MYGVDHIRRVLETYPGVFSGIGEFTIHKEFVSSKVAGEIASLTDPALDRILDFAGEAGLAVIFHSDMDMPFAKAGAEPVFLKQMKDLLRRHPKTTIIWAHIGLGRVVHPAQAQATTDTVERDPANRDIVEAMLTDPTLSHVYFDISWDEVAKYAVASPVAITNTAAMLNRYPDRFLFGTDNVAPADQATQLRVYHLWDPIWERLTPETSLKIRKNNYERIFRQGADGCAGLGKGERQIVRPGNTSRTKTPAPDSDKNKDGGTVKKGSLATVRWLHGYPREWLRIDIVAGLTAAAVVVRRRWRTPRSRGCPCRSACTRRSCRC